jgi:methyl-accepting chemotaxis protein
LISAFVSLVLGIIIAIKTTAALTKVTNILNSSSQQVSSASAQVAASAQELSQASTEQAASLQETSTALEQMTSMVSKNTESSKTAAKTSIRSQEKTSLGKEAVGRMIASMGEINLSNENIAAQIDASNLQMTEIAKVIQVIGTKTKVINDIVFQTKLLSFNASVEAARAGEQGKGFSVVAEEVGNLAQMSGNAAREISAMLDESMKKVDAIVAETKSKVEVLMVEGKKKVSVGMDVANECNDLLSEIVDDVSSLSAASNEISSASQEQSVGINEINKAVGQLDQTNQQNSAVSEQTASAAEDLSTQATALQNAVIQLSNVVEGEFKKSA